MTVRSEPFLLARLVTDQLRNTPVDTALPNWERQVAGSVGTAFEVDLARAAPRTARTRLGLPAGCWPR